MASTETGWTKEFPKVDGYYWWAISGEVRLLEVILGQREAWTQGNADNQWDKAYYWTGKFLGPISPLDAKQLVGLRQNYDAAMLALKETAFSYHVEAEHRQGFATCANTYCATACRLFNEHAAALNPSHLQKETQ